MQAEGEENDEIRAPISNDTLHHANTSATESEHDTTSAPLVRVKQEILSDAEEDVVMRDAQQDAAAGATSAATNDQQNDHAKKAQQEEQEKKYKKANNIKFAMLVKTLEELWEKKKSAKRRWSNEQKLEKLLPKRLMLHLEGGDPYPILRLIMPEIDTSRPNLGMQEKAIAKAWSQALGLGKDSNDSKKLNNYTDPKFNKTDAVGDLSLTVEEVVADRYPKRPSKVTVGQINDLLDDLAAAKSGGPAGGPRNHEWRGEQNNNTSTANKTGLFQRRADWVSRLLQIPLSPLEHKWIVRILLQKVEIGVGHNTILAYLSPYAKDLYSANNSLRTLCATIFDQEWARQRQERDKQEALERQQDKWNQYTPRSSGLVSLGNTISPMLANRTSFESALTDTENRHFNHAKKLAEEEDEDSIKLANSLAIKFPTFICEVKLDGERMLVHVNRGLVTIQTRSSKWYSNIYGPTIAPAIRRALAKYDVDVILDGEMIAWDNGRQEVIPFGSNRTVANDRRKWCYKHGLVEERDTNHHKDAQDIDVYNPGDEYNKFRSSAGDDDTIGEQCWLKYIVFDILYVGGPDAEKIVAESTTLPAEKLPTGSIINLSGFDRKKILYRLMEPQLNEVEFMPSLVVRRTGESEDAAHYFSPTSPSMESGVPCSTIDSMECIMRGDVPDWEEMDTKARGSKTDEDISALRVKGMNMFYEDIVENKGLEGLIFKDLLAPYVLGAESRSLRYWNKMKPDYATDGHSASDIDAVIIGAYYATGMGKAGTLNAFLIGCVDENNRDHFMTLCKVNGGSVNRETLQKMFKKTGFTKNDEGAVSYGNWFREAKHGKSLPDFISERSFQTGSETENGWICQAKKYPDLWIHPEDSVVVTLNCGEVTTSDEFSAGVSLRFPRITKARIEEGDSKPASEVETREKLFNLYQAMELKRQQSSIDVAAGVPSSASATSARFLTVNQYAKKKKAGPKKSAANTASSLPIVEKKDSAALAGVIFTVLEGNYFLDENSLDADQAKAEGWYDDAVKVKCRNDVLKFISRHNGTYKIAISSDADVVLGGRLDDARIVTHAAMLDSDVAPGKRDKALIRFRELGGIVKWTYLFSSVRRWIAEASQVKVESFDEGPRSRQQLALGGPPTIPNTELPRPSRHDYLVLGKRANIDSEGDVFGIQLWKKDINIFDLKRGLEEVKRTQQQETEDRSEDTKRLKLIGAELSNSESILDSGIVIPWQYAAVESLSAQDRWVVSGEMEHLWNFKQQHAEQVRPIVIYPDVFGDDFGWEQEAKVLEQVLSGNPDTRWDSVSEEVQMGRVYSSLPLARTMGAQVTAHLHGGVNHVLCLMKECETNFWQADSFQPKLFENQERAMQLHRRLLKLYDDDDEPIVIKFVSPEWVRAQFDGTRRGLSARSTND